jgi:hypothetical protein
MTTHGARLLAMGGAIGAVALLACGEPGPHNNPYDPLVAVTVKIAGPDTLFSFSEQEQYTAQFTPSFSDSAVTWSVDTVTVPNGTRDGLRDTILPGDLFLKSVGGGIFESIAPPLEPRVIKISIGASVGSIDTTVGRCIPQCILIRTNEYRHTGYRAIYLMQRIARIELRCPDTHLCDTVAVGNAWSVWVDGFDALNRQVYSLTSSTANPSTGPPVVTYTSRDTAIASVATVGTRAATVTARKVGSTWIVATRGALSDSLQVVSR